MDATGYVRKVAGLIKMKKIILIIIMCMFFCSLATAAITMSNLGTFKARDCMSLFQTCDSCSYVNVSSVIHPDGKITSINSAMTKGGQDYNYTFCDTTQNGLYIYNVCGDKAGGFDCEEIQFEITPSGAIRGNPTFYFIILALSLGIIVFGLFMRDAPITILGSFGLYFFGIYLLFYGIDGIKDGVTTWAFGLIVLGLAFYISARSTYELIEG